MIKTPNFPADYVKGETSFKTSWIKFAEAFSEEYSFFQVENEEKVPGFPDVLMIAKDLPAILLEFKVVGKNGKIRFEPYQPAFYKTHGKHVRIRVVVYDPRDNAVYYLTCEEAIYYALKNKPFSGDVYVGEYDSLRGVLDALSAWG
jgi:hypothetical protein